jgi:hypothetical protein
MTKALPRTLLRFNIPKVEFASPFGWILWYLGSRILEFYFVSDILGKFFLSIQAMLIAGVVFPYSIRLLCRQPANSTPSLEYRLWSAALARTPLILGTPLTVPVVVVGLTLLLNSVAQFLPSWVMLVRDAVLLFSAGLGLFVVYKK